MLQRILACAFQSVIELSRTQDEEVGDGTTSVIILGEVFSHLVGIVMLSSKCS